MITSKTENESYWISIWRQFRHHRLGMAALYVVLLFVIVGVYAPFFASSKPFIVYYDRDWYFPLFRYLFYTEFYTKLLDIFFNLLMFILPLMVWAFLFFKNKSLRRIVIAALCLLQITLFFYIFSAKPSDPAASPHLNRQRQETIMKSLKETSHPSLPSWEFDLHYMTPYAKLNLLLGYQNRKEQNELLKQYVKPDEPIPTLWQIDMEVQKQELERQKKILEQDKKNSYSYQHAEAIISYILEKNNWLEEQSAKLQYKLNPPIPLHWEDDAGGGQSLNQHVSWWELTRINRKSLLAALIFGIRISLVVGITAVGLSLMIGIPIGAYAGYYGGTFDIIVSRMLEIWEGMPIFFMLLLVVAITQSKSIFLVIAVIGIFGWTGFSRYIRGEFFKQRNLPYVEACHAMGYRDSFIMFSHILPNALPPLLTLLPFGIMGAITSEAGLSFLGLGEEGSCSWGVLMDEGRSAFPSESYLLWPPAILLTVLLVAIALVGDALRDALDPKMHKN